MENPLNSFPADLDLLKHQDQLTFSSSLMENWDESYVAILNIHQSMDIDANISLLSQIKKQILEYIPKWALGSDPNNSSKKDLRLFTEADECQTRFFLQTEKEVPVLWLTVTESDENLILVLIGCPY